MNVPCTSERRGKAGHVHLCMLLQTHNGLHTCACGFTWPRQKKHNPKKTVRIVMRKKAGIPKEITCKKCGSGDLKQITQAFRFAVPSKANPAAVFHGIISALQCKNCRYQFAMIDSTDDADFWNSLEPWPSDIPKASLYHYQSTLKN